MERRTKIMIAASVAIAVIMLVAYFVTCPHPFEDPALGCIFIVLGIMHIVAPKAMWVLQNFFSNRLSYSNFTEFTRTLMIVFGSAFVLFGLVIL